MTELKKKFLEQEGLINPKPERVSHPFFETLNFFDPLDLPQIRYEMIRTARVENISVSKACVLFGFSREYFYKLERSFMARGYIALLGSTMGRRPIIALNQETVRSATTAPVTICSTTRTCATSTCACETPDCRRLFWLPRFLNKPFTPS